MSISPDDLALLHPVPRAYARSAEALKIPFTVDIEINAMFLKFGRKIYLFRGAATPFNELGAANLAGDKFAANRRLEKLGFPVPKMMQLSVQQFRDGNWSLGALQFPLVIKPLGGTYGGRDVLCNIPNREKLDYFLTLFFKDYNAVGIEEFQGGLHSYRVLIFNDHVIGVMLREPGFVVGDGKHTIKELVPFRNLETLAHKDMCRGPMRIDDECIIKLKSQGLTIDYVPKQGEKIYLREICNSSLGGITHTLPVKFCRENQRLLINATKALHLNLVGIDIVCEDINKPASQSRFYIIEANQNPSISIHHHPVYGKINLVGIKILKYLIKKHRLAYYWQRIENHLY